jgi:hypothetical protein
MNPTRPSINSWVEGIKINRVWTEERDGRRYHLKSRRPGAIPLGLVANGFFVLAGAPVRLFVSLREWQEWEVRSFEGLHGAEGYRAFAQGQAVVGAEALPGINLTAPLDDGTITPQMTAAAARELRRAHSWTPPHTNDLWSHADPHAGNFIYDAATDRARIIDFEVRHSVPLSSDERHIDDVHVFLQDIVGRIPAEKWMLCATSFLTEYDCPEITGAAVRKLSASSWGFGYLWSRIRTSFLPRRELKHRVSALARSWGSM